MPKISALPAMTTADGADPAPIVDDSASQTKKITLTKVKEWLQTLTAWVTPAMWTNPYNFRAYLNQSQSHTNGSFIKVNLNGESYDTNGDFNNTSTYRYIAPVTGIYRFTGGGRTNSNNNGGVIVALYKNGASYSQGWQSLFSGQGFTRSIIADDISLTAGDYVELYFRADVASTTIASGSAETYLAGSLIHKS